MPLSKLLLLFIAASIIECSSTEFVSSLLPVADEGIEPPDPLSPPPPARAAPFPRLWRTEKMSCGCGTLSRSTTAERDKCSSPRKSADPPREGMDGWERPFLTHPIVPLSVVACGSSVGSQDSSRLIDKYSGSRATITRYQAPLTRVSSSPHRPPPDIIVAVEVISPQPAAAAAVAWGVTRFFSIPDSTIIPSALLTRLTSSPFTSTVCRHVLGNINYNI